MPSRIGSTAPSISCSFISNIFVDPARMPQWLELVAEWNPMSAVVAATRELFGTAQGAGAHGVWSLSHPIVTTLIVSALILAVCVPLSVRRYGRTAS